MEITNRLVRVLYVDGVGLVVSDLVGRVHLFDDDLNIVRSSPVVGDSTQTSGRPLLTLAVADRWIIGKDKLGNISRWDLDTLDVLDVLPAAAYRDPDPLLEDEQPSQTASRGIAVFDGKVYVNNGFRQLAIIDLETFKVERVVESFSGDDPLDWICAEHPTVHAASDKTGRVYIGSLATLEFPTALQLDSSNVHRIRYDVRHDRFWAIQDRGTGASDGIANGVMLLGLDGAELQSIAFARNDVEMLTFSPDYDRAYAGGFDGELQIFDNTESKARIIATVSGFTHQLVDATVGVDGSVYLLSQDGELVKVDRDGAFLARADFRRQCVWDIQHSLERSERLYVATDDGVTVVDFTETAGDLTLDVVAHHVAGFGFTRRVVALPHGFAAVTWDRKVYVADADGRQRWVRDLPAFGHALAVSPDHRRVLVASNAGGLEFDLASGELVDRIEVEGTLGWACTYLAGGERVLASRDGRIRVHAADSHEIRWGLDMGSDYYPKRMWATDTALYVSGGWGVKEIPFESRKIARQWYELLDNTVENGLLVDNLMVAVCYGMQMAAYDYLTGEIVGLVEDLADFPKGLASLRTADGRPLVIVGGRGGYLGLYRLDMGPSKGTFAKVKDVYLPRSGVGDIVLRPLDIERADAL
ncbi:WD40 repeat domain-containing protein [Nonomuraea sp. NPDC049269]|uniref:WD40 repeat domain-containing protein n=1 Tax=Nonomuraea sp. NPDC049269 TaxID=3364349 RepID=UPI0037182847